MLKSDIMLTSLSASWFIVFKPPATSSFRSRNILTLFNKNKHYRFNDRWMFSHFPPSYWEFEPRKRHQVQRWSDWLMGTSLNCSHLLSKRILMLRWLVQNNQIQFVFLIIGRWLDCDIFTWDVHIINHLNILEKNSWK